MANDPDAALSGGISGRTRILGLLADPIVQARSPAMANAWLRERGRFGDFVLVPMAVGSEGLADAVAGLRRMRNFAGAIVSMPHKSAMLPLVDEVAPEARLVGALNAVRRADDGRLAGTMLDGEGFVAGLRSAGHEVEGRTCALFGAGGAASAIAFSLARHGCAGLAIANRTPAKAESLAERVRAAFPCVDVRPGADPRSAYDVAINATSLGMKPDDDLPMPLGVIDRARLVAECVVAPETTRLLEVARERGRAVHGGIAMLTAQMELMLRFMGVD
ncbi:MAG TPA: shikimate dehydrogenase [Candidatus Binatia bacterium]|nr:shikimate dehydrogenase [Candidatus Binatia bacterium]